MNINKVRNIIDRIDFLKEQQSEHENFLDDYKYTSDDKFVKIICETNGNGFVSGKKFHMVLNKEFRLNILSSIEVNLKEIKEELNKLENIFNEID